MNLGSLLQDILGEVSSRIISFQMRLHLLIALVKSSEYFRFIESLRTCIMASHLPSGTHSAQTVFHRNIQISSHNFSVTGKKPPGRPKKTWANAVREILKARRLSEVDALNKVFWRSRIQGRPANLSQLGQGGNR